MRCGRCGNENAAANRFCGMCGAALVAKTQAAGQASPGAAGLGSTTAEPRATKAAAADARSKTRPIITGPSFLGLSTPGPARDLHDHLHDHPPGAEPQGGRDALQPSSGNLDYLLEDEEEPRRGWGKLILVVVALALAVGFGYLYFKPGGFDGMKASDKKPAAAQPAPDAGKSADSGDSGTAASPAESGAPAATAAATAAPTTSQGTAPQSLPSQNPPSQNPASQNPSTENIPSRTPPSDPNMPANAASEPAGTDADKKAAPAEPPVAAKAAAHNPVAAKPLPAKSAGLKPGDGVSEAERYIYGRGVRQDCDHGLRLLRPAAKRSNAKAMVSLGVLYSTGTCTPRDLPTAYRWFALALHKEPDNLALQDDLKNLWEKMTQPERQLAIKLSQ